MDLLIITHGNRERRIKDVNDYGIKPTDGYFWFEKNGHRSFVPKAGIVYFGNYHDFKNETEEPVDTKIEEKLKNLSIPVCSLCNKESILAKASALLMCSLEDVAAPYICPNCLSALRDKGYIK